MDAQAYADKRLSDAIIDFLRREHAGRANAIPYRLIMEHFAYPDDGRDNHGFRKLYENRVCSSSGGIFWPVSMAEADAWKAYLSRAHGPIVADRKYKALLAARPDLRPVVAAVQQEFNFEGGQI